MIENIEIKRVEKFERKQISRLYRNGACFVSYLITKSDNTKIGLSKINSLLQKFPGLECFEKGRIIHNDFTPFESLGELSYEEFIKDSDINIIPKLYMRYSFTDKTYLKDEEPQKKAQEENGSIGLEITNNSINIITKEDVILGESIIEIPTKENIETKLEEIINNLEEIKPKKKSKVKVNPDVLFKDEFVGKEIKTEREIIKTDGFFSITFDYEDFIIYDISYPTTHHKEVKDETGIHMEQVKPIDMDFHFKSNEKLNISGDIDIIEYDKKGNIKRKISIIGSTLKKINDTYILTTEYWKDE